MWVGGRITQRFSSTKLLRVHTAGKVEEGLNKFVGTHLVSRKVRGCSVPGRKLGRGGIT